MKIVILDGHAINPGDLSWDALQGLGELEVFDRTPEDAIVTLSWSSSAPRSKRCRAADFALTFVEPARSSQRNCNFWRIEFGSPTCCLDVRRIWVRRGGGGRDGLGLQNRYASTRVRRRAGNSREPSIQLGHQVFETAHRVQFSEDRASLLESPRFDSCEFSLFQP